MISKESSQDLSNLEQLLERLGQAAHGLDRVSLEVMVRAVGRRSFGPLLLVVGVILISPFSGIPGFPPLWASAYC